MSAETPNTPEQFATSIAVVSSRLAYMKERGRRKSDITAAENLLNNLQNSIKQGDTAFSLSETTEHDLWVFKPGVMELLVAMEPTQNPPTIPLAAYKNEDSALFAYIQNGKDPKIGEVVKMRAQTLLPEIQLEAQYLVESKRSYDRSEKVPRFIFKGARFLINSQEK